MNKADAITVIKIIDTLIELNDVSKIIDTFYAAFHKYTIGDGDYVSLHGSLNLGGTKSSRLSHSDPNMGNLPSSGTIYAKPVKSSFRAKPGWVMVGCDFNSLEDMISALVTRDPMKLKVYTDGYCGHCLRAYSYFPELMPDIVDTVESINSIKHKYPKLRQLSKIPTFCLTYSGSWRAITEQTGIPQDEAKAIEKAYHALYVESDNYVAAELKKASQTGYIEVAFGLRLRTPILGKTVLGQRNTPYEAAAEGRTAGNAIGQSWGLLNSRAANEFMEKVWDSEYRLDILPVNQIHDASYYLVRNDVHVVKFVNDNLVKAMQWQDHPAIAHPTVKLGGELSIFFPTWADEIVIPNGATEDEIKAICIDAQNK